MIYLFSFELKILEEMKCMEVKPNIQTYICLLNACAADGRIDRVYAIILLLLLSNTSHYKLPLPLILPSRTPLSFFSPCFLVVTQCRRIGTLFFTICCDMPCLMTQQIKPCAYNLYPFLFLSFE